MTPALAGSRSAAREVKCIANLHGLAAVVHMYKERYQQRYPFAFAGQPMLMTPPGEEEGYLVYSAHWDLGHTWPALMHDTAPFAEWYRAWLCPGAPRRQDAPWLSEDGSLGATPSYWLTYGFFARPQVWSAGSSADPALLRAVGDQDVWHPSGKVMFWDAELAHHYGPRKPEARPVLFADGHAGTRRPADARPAATNPFTGLARQWLDTPEGVHGVDY